MSETEKITINLSAVDLGKIDLLVQEGIYTNRTDFIRTAIRSQLEKHTLEVQQSITRHSFGVGVFGYDRSDLERHASKGEQVDFKIVGMLKLEDDIPAELARKVVKSIRVHGIFIASQAVKEALADRTS
jgi:Arc/MetJ-type ribon-helix-helix transcriptional regulator